MIDFKRNAQKSQKFLSYRKLDEYELKETAAKVVKSATKSFQMINSPSAQGQSGLFSSDDVDTDELPSVTSTMISTPIARKSREAEHVEILRKNQLGKAFVRSRVTFLSPDKLQLS